MSRLLDINHNEIIKKRFAKEVILLPRYALFFSSLHELKNLIKS